MLRDYQVDISNRAIDILNEYGLVYLSMQVRTGKTLTALNTALLFGSKHVLFVTKKKAISSIYNDYKLLNPDYTIEVINYESIEKAGPGYDLLILDEAHCMGAYPKETARTKTVKQMAKGKPIIYLSGTPTPESYSQLYHQLHVSSFSPFRNYINFYKWSYDFVNIGTKYLYGKNINDYKDANKDKIDNVTKHLFISYTQQEAGFENNVTEKVLTVEMKPSTYKLVDRLRKDLVIQGNSDVILADTPAKLMQKLHQLYSGTIKLESGNRAILDNSKALFIKEYFKGQKIAIFYKFIAEFDLLKETFPNWTNNPDVFADSDDKVFLCQIVSGREGITLKTADALVFYNIDFSAVSYFQAKDRLTAKDRVKDNIVYWVFSKGGIEHQIYDTVKQKKDYTLKWFNKWNQ